MKPLKDFLSVADRFDPYQQASLASGTSPEALKAMKTAFYIGFHEGLRAFFDITTNAGGSAWEDVLVGRLIDEINAEAAILEAELSNVTPS